MQSCTLRRDVGWDMFSFKFIWWAWPRIAFSVSTKFHRIQRLLACIIFSVFVLVIVDTNLKSWWHLPPLHCTLCYSSLGAFCFMLVKNLTLHMLLRTISLIPGFSYTLFAGFDKEMGTRWYCSWGGHTTSLVPPIVLELAMIRRYRKENIVEIYIS